MPATCTEMSETTSLPLSEMERIKAASRLLRGTIVDGLADPVTGAISDDDNLDIYDQLEMQSVEPKLTREQWKALADRIGMAQFAQITKDANDLVLSKVAVPDFSQSVSETLSPPAPSAS